MSRSKKTKSPPKRNDPPAPAVTVEDDEQHKTIRFSLGTVRRGRGTSSGGEASIITGRCLDG